MSFFLATSAVVAAGIVHAVTTVPPPTGVQLAQRFSAIGGSLGRIGGADQQEVIATCDAFTKCSYDAAIAKSYARCAEAGGQVGKVCNVTTAVMENVGKTVHAAYSAVKSLF